MSALHTIAIDITRVDWFDQFFSRFVQPDAAKVIDSAAAEPIALEATDQTDDFAIMAMSGWSYWALYIKGYLEYSALGEVAPDNVYLRYLVAHFGPRGYDPGIQTLLRDVAATQSRVTLRYQDFDAFRRGEEGSTVDQVVLTIIEPPPLHAKVLHDAHTGEQLPPSVVDGHHRIFLARLFRTRTLSARVVQVE